MLVQMFYDFMVLVVSSSMFTIVMVVMNMSACMMFFHVVNVMFMLMGMLMSSGMNMLFVLWVFHD